MLHRVEIRRIGSDLASPMGEMRSWLDRHHVQALLFEHAAGGAGITFRIWFDAEAQAKAFADAFSGRLSQGTNPGGAALWDTVRHLG